MKYKLISIGAMVLICVFCATAAVSSHQTPPRIHQHLEAVDPADREGSAVLPVISLDTRGLPLTQFVPEGVDSYGTQVFHTVEGRVRVYDSGAGSVLPTSDANVTSAAYIRYRGNSSLRFDKKSYKVDLIHPDGTDNKDHEILGMPAYDQWVLNGPYLDKTLLRNYMCMNMAGEVMSDTPEVRFCELFVDGVYQGVYLAMESIALDEERVNITSYEPGAPYTSYILRVDRATGTRPHADVFSKYAMILPHTNDMEILYPGQDTLTPQLAEYISRDFSAFEKTLYSYDYDDPLLGYGSFIDVNSFVDYFIINEFFKNYDAGLYSTYFYKDLRGKIHIGPVWDFNNACDNFMAATQIHDGTGFALYTRSWYFKLCKEQTFVEQVIARYRMLRKGVLSEEYLLNYVDESAAFLGDAVDRNYQVWGYTFDAAALDDDQRLDPVERNPADYEDAIGQLKGFLKTRGDWMDENIELLYQQSHPSKNKKFNH